MPQLAGTAAAGTAAGARGAARPDDTAPGIPARSHADPQAGTHPDTPADTPAVLADLIAAGLVSHELIGDPDRLGSETTALQALCALVSGPVWRIEAYHYAFRAGNGDLGGRLALVSPGDRTAALAEALEDRLGPDAVWLNPTDLLAEADGRLEQPLLLLRAQAAAVADGLSAAGPEVAAVISARYAAEVARLSTGVRSPLAAHVDRLGGQVEALAAEVAALRASSGAIPGEALAAAVAPALAPLLAPVLAAALAPVMARLEALADQVEGGIRADLERLTALAATQGAFQETLGVTLAEIIARLEQRFEAGHPGLFATRPGTSRTL